MSSVSRPRYAFLSSPRWLGLIAGIVAVSVVCTLLGFWQWSRYEARAEQVDLVETNYQRDPVPLTDLVPSPQAALDTGDEWRQVQVTGEYVGDVLVLPQRGVGGTPADHVLGVLAVDVGAAEPWLMLVDRGWYRTDTFADHGPAQERPEGQVQAALRLRPAEEPSPRVLDAGQVHRLNPAQAAQVALGEIPDGEAELVEGVYGQLAAESQGGSAVVPAELSMLPRPAADLGSHLSYALQWWVFALGCYVGLVILARREARDLRPSVSRDAGDDSGDHRPGGRGDDSRRRVRARDQDAEDEDIESQLQARATSSA